MFSFFLYMFFSLHWWSRSTISLIDICCSVAASLSVAAVAGAPMPLFMYKFFRFSYIVWFLALVSTLSLSLWVFGLLRPASLSAATSVVVVVAGAPMPLFINIAFTQYWRCFKFFLMFWHIQVRL